MNFVRIAPGEFMMGSPETEAGRESNETQHKVRITRGFLMGATCVTQGQWKAVMGTSVIEQRDKYNRHWILAGEEDDLPMYYMSWDETAAFCKKLGEKEGRHYRLPTEAEWEYACRARTSGAFGGTGNIDDMAWYADNSGDRRIDSFAIFSANKNDYDRQIFKNYCHLHPVAKKKPNAWGLYNILGNVYEWCSDFFSQYPAGDAGDPTGPKKGEERVVRGGSFFVFPRWCRSASRDAYPGDLPEKRIVGFRVCID
jgi:formylglycine-generating enzyme required for sulfatase activity